MNISKIYQVQFHHNLKKQGLHYFETPVAFFINAIKLIRYSFDIFFNTHKTCTIASMCLKSRPSQQGMSLLLGPKLQSARGNIAGFMGVQNISKCELVSLIALINETACIFSMCILLLSIVLLCRSNKKINIIIM